MSKSVWFPIFTSPSAGLWNSPVILQDTDGSSFVSPFRGSARGIGIEDVVNSDIGFDNTFDEFYNLSESCRLLRSDAFSVALYADDEIMWASASSPAHRT